MERTGRRPPVDFSARLFSLRHCLFLSLDIAGVSIHSEKEKRNKRGTRVRNAGRANEKDEKNLVNGAVNLEGRPIISLLPTFLDARHFFGYEPRVRLKTCYTHAWYLPGKERKKEE